MTTRGTAGAVAAGADGSISPVRSAALDSAALASLVVPGFPGAEAPDFGPGPWMRHGGPRGMRGPRARRGDVRAAALALLSEQPMNGYQIIQEISERSGGVWRPSPGSVYPALQQLEDEGLIRAEASDGGRRAYQLTDEGTAYAQAHSAELKAPWDVVAGSAGGVAD